MSEDWTPLGLVYPATIPDYVDPLYSSGRLDAADLRSDSGESGSTIAARGHRRNDRGGGGIPEGSKVQRLTGLIKQHPRTATVVVASGIAFAACQGVFGR